MMWLAWSLVDGVAHGMYGMKLIRKRLLRTSRYSILVPSHKPIIAKSEDFREVSAGHAFAR